MRFDSSGAISGGTTYLRGIKSETDLLHSRRRRSWDVEQPISEGLSLRHNVSVVEQPISEVLNLRLRPPAKVPLMAIAGSGTTYLRRIESETNASARVRGGEVVEWNNLSQRD